MYEPSDDSRSDHTLIAALNAGDGSAFEPLYRRHRDWVVQLAARITGDEDLALDVLQETFLYLLRKFPGFKLTCQLRSFLYPAVRNLALAARRKAIRTQSDGTEPVDLDLPAPEPPVEPDADRERLAVALANLPEHQREVLLLRFVDGFRLQEIAAALGIPLGTVKSRLHLALAALRADARTREMFGR
ncbi:MAG: sigma-70 family RNA polymerase sigma factor [Verrucomicrobia bacterium]|nr:sigma-70 family RNA polymerase sigma factor [Verrucomicrobiota bacterium]